MNFFKPINKDGTKQTSKFGYRMHPILKKRKKHNGYDLANSGEVELHAICNGNVSYNDTDNKGWGYYARLYYVIEGIQFIAYYAHMDRNKKNIFNDRKIKKGDIIGYMGNTGESKGQHLHLEIRFYDSDVKKWKAYDYRNPDHPYVINYFVDNWYKER